MEPSYYGSNEGKLEGEPLTHFLLGEFFQKLIDKNEVKLLKVHERILKDLREGNEADFVNIKRDIKTVNSTMRQLNVTIENIKKDLVEMNEDIWTIRKDILLLRKYNKKLENKDD